MIFCLVRSGESLLFVEINEILGINVASYTNVELIALIVWKTFHLASCEDSSTMHRGIITKVYTLKTNKTNDAGDITHQLVA